MLAVKARWFLPILSGATPVVLALLRSSTPTASDCGTSAIAETQLGSVQASASGGVSNDGRDSTKRERLLSERFGRAGLAIVMLVEARSGGAVVTHMLALRVEVGEADALHPWCRELLDEVMLPAPRILVMRRLLTR